MLRKANQKRSLDDLVIQKGRFDWNALFSDASDEGEIPLRASLDDDPLRQALGQFEDQEDQEAAQQAAAEEGAMEGADEVDFGFGDPGVEVGTQGRRNVSRALSREDEDEDEGESEPYSWGKGGHVLDYMLGVVQRDEEGFFLDWRV